MHFKERLKGVIPSDSIDRLSNRLHIIGDIAIVNIHSDMEIYKKDIAIAIISEQKNIRTVLWKTSKIESNKRIARFETLVGKDTVTIHKENGFRYKMDVKDVFFNSHLSYERRRVALEVRPNERVFIPFCGVGPFAIPIASLGAKVIALERNNSACKWLAENARLNKVYNNIDIIKADAFRIANLIDFEKTRFNRIIIPTPYGMDNILDNLSSYARKDCMLHFYTFKKKYQIEDLIEKYENMGLMVDYYRKCGNVAPGVSRWVFDLIKV